MKTPLCAVHQAADGHMTNCRCPHETIMSSTGHCKNATLGLILLTDATVWTYNLAGWQHLPNGSLTLRTSPVESRKLPSTAVLHVRRRELFWSVG